MSSKDLHSKPFTEETISKLEIFEKYLEEWLPVFVYSNFKVVNICDFFAGTGEDVNGVAGSPLRILNIIEKYKADIEKKNFNINVIFNEFKKSKFLKLHKLLSTKYENMGKLIEFVKIDFFNEDFKKLFNSKKKELENTANLIFIDQSGIKYVPQVVLFDLERFKTTDFMFFISSSYLKRFPNLLDKIFPNLETEKISVSNYYNIHRMILDEYRALLPSNSRTKLYPFSIKKGSNIFGLIFGTKHPLAIDKFLRIAWDRNKLNGEANYDIDDDLKNIEVPLFPEMRKFTKLENFEQELEKLIMTKMIISSKEIYDFTLESGHIPEHAIKKIKELKKNKLLEYIGHTNINFNKCYKERDIKIFKVLENEKV
jgi:three-Cys-motif partner protein